MRSLIGQDALRVGPIYPKVRLELRYPINQHFPVLILNICLDSDFAYYRKHCTFKLCCLLGRLQVAFSYSDVDS